MNLGIQDKWALVTGAGRGLGEGICKDLAKEGARVIACARTKADLERLCHDLPGETERHRWLAVDLASQEGPETLLTFLTEQGLSPDIVVNNVGGNLGHTDPLGPLEEWRAVMRLNVEVAIELNRRLIPAMRERKWGRICHVSSISALENQGPPAYCAAKAALNAYVRSLGRFVSPDNVILTSVMPGAVFTEGGYWDDCSRNRPEHVEKYLRERMAIQRFGTVAEISGIVSFLCSEHASFCVGSAFLVDGGQGRIIQNSDF